MSVNLFKDRRLSLFKASGLVTIFGLAALCWCGARPTAAAPRPLEHAGMVPTDRAVCQYEEAIPSAIDPCPLFRQAQDLMDRLTPSATEYLENASAGFRPDRSLRVQEALFREDLKWQSRGFSRSQMNVMVFVSVALSLESAEAQISELRSSLQETGDPKIARRIERINLYRSQAVALLDELSRDLRDLSNYELSFYF